MRKDGTQLINKKQYVSLLNDGNEKVILAALRAKVPDEWMDMSLLDKIIQQEFVLLSAAGGVIIKLSQMKKKNPDITVLTADQFKQLTLNKDFGLNIRHAAIEGFDFNLLDEADLGNVVNQLILGSIYHSSISKLLSVVSAHNVKLSKEAQMKILSNPGTLHCNDLSIAIKQGYKLSDEEVEQLLNLRYEYKSSGVFESNCYFLREAVVATSSPARHVLNSEQIEQALTCRHDCVRNAALSLKAIPVSEGQLQRALNDRYDSVRFWAAFRIVTKDNGFEDSPDLNVPSELIAHFLSLKEHGRRRSFIYLFDHKLTDSQYELILSSDCDDAKIALAESDFINEKHLLAIMQKQDVSYIARKAVAKNEKLNQYHSVLMAGLLDISESVANEFCKKCDFSLLTDIDLAILSKCEHIDVRLNAKEALCRSIRVFA